MANTKTVGASGKDYTTIGGALTWMAANHDFDTDGIATISIEDSAEYDEQLGITGIVGTPSITAYLKITVSAGNRHSGVYGTGHARVKNTSAGHIFTIDEGFTFIEYLQIEQASSGASNECCRVNDPDCLFSRCIFTTSTTTQQDAIYPNLANGEAIYVDNCVFSYIQRSGMNQQASTTSKIYSDFNSGIKCGTDYASSSGLISNQASSANPNFEVWNTVGYDCRSSGNASLAFYDGFGGTWTGDYNISSQATDASAHQRFGSTNNWKYVSTETTEPVSGSNCWINDDVSTYDLGIAGDNAYCESIQGTDRVGSEPDARQDFSIDIVGNARDGTTPTIGAFEYVAAGGSPYTLTADGGAYTETGTAAGLIAARELAVVAGSYLETGSAAGLAHGSVVGAGTGAYSWLGQAASLTYAAGASDYTLTAVGGTYLATGQTAGLIATRLLAAVSAAYLETGSAASLQRDYTLAAVGGAFTETGQAAGLKHDRKLGSVAGSYALAGQSVGLAHGRALAMGAGAYAFAGQAATLTYAPALTDHTLIAVAGAYVFSGSLASLVWSGAAAGAGPAITMPLIISNGAEAALPISIAVSSGGGVSGLTVTMAIRDGSTLNSYLDFDDLTFKTSGWVSQTDALVDQSGGYYADTLNVAGITNLPDTNLIVEFGVSGSLNAVAMGSVISAKGSILGASNALTLGKFLALKDA